MKKFLIQTLSLFLTALMLFGIVPLTLSVSADTTSDDEEEELSEILYENEIYYSPEEKLATMVKYYSKGDYDLYFQEYTGECALVDRVTGEILFSNPYDVGASVGSKETKYQILSQIAINYIDTDGTSRWMYSYKEAAQREQITFEKVKTGVRVEYIIGDANARKLVPKQISKHSFEENILSPIAAAIGEDNYCYKKLKGFYVEHNLDNILSETQKAEEIKKYPILTTTAIYILDTATSTVEFNTLESYIKQWAPNYTYEQMDEDYKEIGFEDEETTTPVFSLALEYSINDDGMTVRLPANGLRFDATTYSLETINVLPYFGCGNYENEGYTFYPDGSGALFRFEDLNIAQTTNIKNLIYGTDYAYNTIESRYQKAIRYPVYGIYEEQEYYNYLVNETEYDNDGILIDNQEPTVKTFSRTTTTEEEAKQIVENDTTLETLAYTVETRTAGFLAVIEEGESLTSLATYHAGSSSNYNTIKTFFNPRPKDTYEVRDAISVTGETGMSETESSSTAVALGANRKYTGNLKIRYIMLHDETLATTNNLESWFSTDYNGMALAYRNYLLENEIITRLTEEDVQDDIPLFIETFGAMEATEKILSIPVTVLKPLASFEDIIDMYDDLNEDGVKNVIFQLRGYTNGGMYATYPGKLHWEKAVGGKSGYEDLLEYAEEVNQEEDNNLQIYPDFDFVWLWTTGAFDGVSVKRDVIKTIDDRYAGRVVYSPSQQTYIESYESAMSPSQYSRFYKKLVKKYNKYNNSNISLSTLGQILNTDFDEDDPYNREENKKNVISAFEYIQNNIDSGSGSGSVMTNGGNSYTWKYIDYIVDAPLSTSGYTRASCAVPFFGMVLHGFLQYAGSAVNMEGNSQTAVLQAIENGGSIYYILSYENTELLKEDEFLNEYYSINYDIWADDVKETYLELNEQLADVQTKLILEHKFITGQRVPDLDELQDMLEEQLAEMEQYEIEMHQKYLDERAETVSTARELGVSLLNDIKTWTTSAEKSIAELEKQLTSVNGCIATLTDLINKNATESRITSSKSSLCTSYKTYMTSLANIYMAQKDIDQVCDEYQQILNEVKTMGGVPQSVLDELEAAYQEMLTYKVAIAPKATDAWTKWDTMKATIEDSNLLSDEEISTNTPLAKSKIVVEEEVVVEEDEEFDPYLSDDDSIVAVTYGGKNGDDSVPYKTFILNYNSFDVIVEFEGVSYTIGANGYIAIYR